MTVKILQGDCREVLKTLPDQSVHMVVTSPPYFGLREYQTATWDGGDPACDHVVGEIRTGLGMAKLSEQYRGGGKKVSEPKPMFAKGECPKCGAMRVDRQIGQEETPDDYVAQMVAAFREIWRVLRDDGCAFLNLGDSYAANRSYQVSDSKHPSHDFKGANSMRVPDGLKPGDLIGIPWMVAFALRVDGWWLRMDNVWAKKNCMPESIENRTTRAHEYIFHLTKSGSSTFWTHRDRPGVRSQPAPDYRWVHRKTGEEMSVEPTPTDDKNWRRINLWSGHNYFYDKVAIEEDGEIPAGTRAAKGSAERVGANGVNSRPAEYATYTGKRNKRSVWWMATMPFPESHFAVFPPELPETCVKAGTSERGCCPHCAAPWVRLTEKNDTGRRQKMADGWDTGSGGHGTIHRNGREKGQTGVPVMERVTTGWMPTCSCPSHNPVPCVVLDPFSGAGTTALVSDRLGRDCIGIELNEEYINMSRRRITRDAPLFAEVT